MIIVILDEIYPTFLNIKKLIRELWNVISLETFLFSKIFSDLFPPFDITTDFQIQWLWFPYKVLGISLNLVVMNLIRISVV